MTETARTRTHRILGVGVATLDIINEVVSYPEEDSEVRALGQTRRRGGNVTNTLVVLSQLGHACVWLGTLGGDPHSAEVIADLDLHRIAHSHCPRIKDGRTPTSYVLLSRANASRTIVHYRDLPELTAAQFHAVDTRGYQWVHFEGRNPAETAAMLSDLAGRRPDCPVSLEVEKPRPGIEALLRGPEVLFFSRAFAAALGYTDPRRFLADQWARTTARLLVLPWGADGAYGQVRGGAPFFAPPHRAAEVQETLGAGDVLNAAVIDGLLAGLDPPAALARACRLAGHKCGRQGLAGLVQSASGAGLLDPRP
jgi:ketohexokinase